MKIETIEPHGLCAGVNAAIAKALGLRNAYCLHELVHNEMVVGELKALGHIFVDRMEDVPDGATVVFSAHGVPPAARRYAAAHGMTVVDTTCPFVAKAHRAVRDFAGRGVPVAILGDPRHVEVEGVVAEAVDAGCEIVGVGAPPFDAAKFSGRRIGVVSQTTMDADEVRRQTAELAKSFDVETAADVCLVTKERQDAVRAFCGGGGGDGGLAVLVLGSRTSSNSRRLAEVAAKCGARAFMAGSVDELRALDFSGVARLGVTSGASTPERFFEEAMRILRANLI